MSTNVKKLLPTSVNYRGHTIELTHRKNVNDWTYSILYHIPLRMSDKAPRYDTALAQAKADIDALIDAQNKKKQT